jgi:4-hydroxybutyryl-CoA dehydratase/vinylacetyl-CoA-Delta-isomerase
MSQKHPSGVFLPDALFASAAKLCEVDAISNASTLLINITGGSIATLPSERDLRAPATKKYLEKYLQGSTSVSVENRMRMFRLCEYLSGGSSTIRAASHFTAAAPEVQKVFIATAANIDKLKDYAKKLAKIRE